MSAPPASLFGALRVVFHDLNAVRQERPRGVRRDLQERSYEKNGLKCRPQRINSRSLSDRAIPTDPSGLVMPAVRVCSCRSGSRPDQDKNRTWRIQKRCSGAHESAPLGMPEEGSRVRALLMGGRSSLATLLDLKTNEPLEDRALTLTAIRADAINLGLAKMSEV
jgi:hypothetical protein